MLYCVAYNSKLISAAVVGKHVLPQRLSQPYTAFCVNVKSPKTNWSNHNLQIRRANG